MKKRVVVRALADQDIDRALDHYAREAPDSVDSLLDALEATLASIVRSPGLGSRRFAHELDIPGLRHRATRRFPYLIFYLEGPQQLDVLRVLHQHRDLAQALLDE